MKILPLRAPEDFGLGWVLPQLGKKQWEILLGTLPVTEPQELIHVGKLDGELPRNQTSHEGALLSASEYPEEWVEIAKLGESPWWTIQGTKGLRLIEIIGNDKTWEKVLWWALSWGIIETKSLWKTPVSSNEEDAILYALCHSLEEARESHDLELGDTQETTALVPAPNLWAYWNQRAETEATNPHPSFTRPAVAMLLVEGGAHTGWTTKAPVLGLHWDEELNPAMLSAPRAGLSPAMLGLGRVGDRVRIEKFEGQKSREGNAGNQTVEGSDGQTGENMTKPQEEKLIEVAKKHLANDLGENPEHWAEWIIKQAPNQKDRALEYLDLPNLDKEKREGILKELGFNPTKGKTLEKRKN